MDTYAHESSYKCINVLLAARLLRLCYLYELSGIDLWVLYLF